MKRGIVLIGNNRFPTLLAIDPKEQQQGLMHQPWPPPIMCFCFNNSSFRPFWMVNTPSPLDIVFCRNNKVLDILSGEPNSTKLIGGDLLSDFVTEFPIYTCKSNNINVGDEIFCFSEEKRIY